MRGGRRANDYEWLSGEVPFQGAPIEVALQHLNDPLPSLRASAPDVPPAVEEVVLKAKDRSVAWSPDEQSLLSGDDTGHLILWQAA